MLNVGAVRLDVLSEMRYSDPTKLALLIRLYLHGAITVLMKYWDGVIKSARFRGRLKNCGIRHL
jgi:hypothetical protein